MFYSVIIPIFQSEATINRCLDSLKKQSFGDFEAVLIDDGSSDKSREICEQFRLQDERFLYVRKENGGPSSARNLGLDLAKGEYVVFLDSDDCYRESYLENFYHLICSNKEYGHFWCGYTTISDNPKENGTGACLPTKESIVSSNRSEIMTLHSHLFLASLCNKAFHNTVIQDNKIRMKDDLSLGEDLLFNLEYLDCSSNTKILIWNRPEYDYYCFSQNSLNHKYRADLNDIYITLRTELFSYLQKWNAPEEQFAEYETMTFYMLEQIVQNYDNPSCKMSRFEKKRAKELVINSEEFKKALREGVITIHPLLKWAYSTGNVFVVEVVSSLSQLKRMLK